MRQVITQLSEEIRELNSVIHQQWLHAHALEHVIEYAGELHPFDMGTLTRLALELQLLRGYKMGLEKAVITTVRGMREHNNMQQLQ